MKQTTTPATTTAAAADDSRDTGKRRSRRQLLVFVLVFAAAILVSILALVVQAVWHFFFTNPKQPTIPVLTMQEFNRAKQIWVSHGIDSYDLDLEFKGGSNSERIHLEVRKGKVTTVTKNGKPPAQERTREEWTVPNQFAMIAADMAKEAHGSFGTREGVVIVLRAEFDPELGYPKRYVLDVVKGRSPLHSNWTVTHFQVVP